MPLIIGGNAGLNYLLLVYHPFAYSVNKLQCSLYSRFKVGDLEQMWVISSNIFFAGKLSGMQVTPCMLELNADRGDNILNVTTF